MGQTISVDVAVIGGGPGGYTAAFRAADLGLTVCLIEKADRLGGVCLNVGCIPSKTLLHVATMIEEAENASEFGITFAAPEINLDSVREKKDGIIKQLTGGLDGLCKARKVNRLIGTASFATKTTLSIKGDEGETIVSFKNAIIASGSRPFVLPNIPDDPRIWDSTDALRLDTIPKRLLIIGGGIIGLEMAQVYSALGSEITIVEMLQQLIPPADKDLVQPLFLKLKKSYQIYTGTKVTTIEAHKTGIKVSFDGPKKSETAEYDAVLVAVGRRPNSEEIELGNVGIVPSERGFIEVNEKQQTSVATYLRHWRRGRRTDACS